MRDANEYRSEEHNVTQTCVTRRLLLDRNPQGFDGRSSATERRFDRNVLPSDVETRARVL